MRLRERQRLLAFVYAGLAVIACAQQADLVTSVAAVVMAIAGYGASRPLPDLPWSAEGRGWQLVSMLVVAGLAVALVAGHGLPVAIVGGYCAGNRARAGGLRLCSP